VYRIASSIPLRDATWMMMTWSAWRRASHDRRYYSLAAANRNRDNTAERVADHALTHTHSDK